MVIHMFETPNDAHNWDDKHQMRHMFETTNAKWRTCLYPDPHSTDLVHSVLFNQETKSWLYAIINLYMYYT